MTDNEKIDVLKQFNPMILSTVGKINRHKWLSPQDCEELANDLRMKAWTSLDAYDPEKSSLSTWMYNSIRLKGANWIFKHFHRGTKKVDRNSIDFSSLQFDDATYDDAIDAFAQVSDSVMINDLSLKLILESIPDENDSRILERWIYGESMAEIAKSENCKPQNIQQKIVRIRKWLRKNMEEPK